MSDQNRVELWLNKALELEYRGRDFYENAATAVKDPAVRDFFNFLADQERVHIKIIKQIHSRLDDESCWLTDHEHTPIGGSINKIFAAMAKNKIPADQGLLQAIENGIHFETEAAALYKEALPQATCEGEKKFLTALYGEENEHRQILADMQLFYTNPEAWAENMAGISLDGV